MTLAQLAKEALEIQDACNACGLSQRFAKVMIELGAYTNGTDERNRHPIVILWLDKFCSLARCQDVNNDSIIAAYEAVEAMAECKPTPA